MWNYSDIKLLTLHRMLEAQVLDKPASAPVGFNLDRYIASGELDFAVGGTITLKAMFSASAAFHLAERPLSDDQTIAEQKYGHMLVTATVQDTSELRWWLLGFGDQVEVLAPAELRDEFTQVARSILSQYDK